MFASELVLLLVKLYAIAPLLLNVIIVLRRKRTAMKIPKMNKCVGCTMVCMQLNNEKNCIKNSYKYYDSADGFDTKKEAWKYYGRLRAEYYKNRGNKLLKQN